MLVHELKDAKEREKALEEAQRRVVDALNEKIQSQSQELISKDQKCIKLEEELKRQEALARDRKSQIEELKQRLQDVDFPNRPHGVQGDDNSQTEGIDKLRQQIDEIGDKCSLEMSQQSEKHLERERHLNSQILSYQTELAAHKATKELLRKEILALKSGKELMD